jgi:hypothetical protein
VTGELDKAAQTYQAEIEIYQRDGHYTDLSALYSELGQYEKVVGSRDRGSALYQIRDWPIKISPPSLSARSVSTRRDE